MLHSNWFAQIAFLNTFNLVLISSSYIGAIEAKMQSFERFGKIIQYRRVVS